MAGSTSVSLSKGWMTPRTRHQSITVFIFTVESKLYKILQNQPVMHKTFWPEYFLAPLGALAGLDF